jgi:hypothetical protein
MVPPAKGKYKGAADAVKALDELIANSELDTAIEDVCEFNTNAVASKLSNKSEFDALTALELDIANEALVTNEAVPNKEPVIPPLTFKEPVICNEPDRV